MVYYDKDSNISKSSDVREMLQQFCDVRLEYYTMRKEHLIGILNKEINILSIKIRFIMEFINGIIHISNILNIPHHLYQYILNKKEGFVAIDLQFIII